MNRVVIYGVDCTEHLAAVVAAAPTLTAAQSDRLRTLLQPSQSGVLATKPIPARWARHWQAAHAREAA